MSATRAGGNPERAWPMGAHGRYDEPHVVSLGIRLRIVGKPVTKGPPFVAREMALANLHGSVQARIVDVLHKASAMLGAQGIRHGTLGALAIGVYGWPRATGDVDLLVGPEAWRRLGTGGLEPLIDFPEEIDGVHVDYLHPDVAGDFLIESLDRPLVTEGVPISPIEVVVCTKLLRMRMRDEADIVEVLKAGLVDANEIRAYLDEHTPMLVPRYVRLVERAAEEKREEAEDGG